MSMSQEFMSQEMKCLRLRYIFLFLTKKFIKLKAAFDLFDHDGSGTIDPNELKAAFEELGFKGEAKFIY